MEMCEVKNENFQGTAESMLKRAWEERDFSDVTLVSEDETRIQAHKIVLSSSSSFFSNILKKHSHPNPLIFVKGVSSSLLSSMVAFMYKGQVEVGKEDLDKFLEACTDFKIRGLDPETFPLFDPPPPETGSPLVEEHLKSPTEQARNKLLEENDSKSDLIRNGGKQELALVENTDLPIFQSMWKKSDYHTSKNPKPNNLSCNMCDYKVHRNDLLKLHMNSKHNLEKFHCSVQACGKVYSSKINLKAHIKTNHNCEVCDLTFPNRNDLLKLHMNSKHNLEKFHCSVQACGKVYSSKINLRAHIKTNHNCEVCDLTFPNRNDLQIHNRRGH